MFFEIIDWSGRSGTTAPLKARPGFLQCILFDSAPSTNSLLTKLATMFLAPLQLVGRLFEDRSMKDMTTQLEKLRVDAAECALIRDLATDPKKRELFARLADHLQVLAAESGERRWRRSKPERTRRREIDPISIISPQPYQSEDGASEPRTSVLLRSILRRGFGENKHAFRHISSPLGCPLLWPDHLDEAASIISRTPAISHRASLGSVRRSGCRSADALRVGYINKVLPPIPANSRHPQKQSAGLKRSHKQTSAPDRSPSFALSRNDPSVVDDVKCVSATIER